MTAAVQARATATGVTEPRLRGPVVALPLRGIPRLPPSHVDRPRLRRALDAAGRRNLVLVSAPAGSGKTALLAEWAQARSREQAVGWVTFEPGDRRFWLPFTGALQDAGVQVPEAFPRWTGACPSDRLLGVLVDAVRRAPRRVTIVLDNWDAPTRETLGQIDVLLRHCAGRLTLVVASRSDPRLPLPRYRLEDRVLELRLPELAFTDVEAGLLLDALGVHPGPGAPRRLNARVNGWAAGLVFLGRALRGTQPVRESVAHVLRHTTEIDDYVVSEVLDAQPPAIREFLLETSELETLCPDHVERLLGPAARVTLHDLIHGSTFVEPDPGRAHCFRYQAFFREVLRAQHAHESASREARSVTDFSVPPTTRHGVVSVIPRQRPPSESTLAVEPLTPRETEVLWHLEELLTTDEMAATMFVSVNTVRTHVRSVLRKLGVDRRNAAVRRGRELGLIPARRP